MTILGISGSLRAGSHNSRLLAAAAGGLPPEARLVIWDGLREVPPFDEDDEAAPPPGAEALRRALSEADAVVIATPEYNSSIPGQLKNALDWASRPYATSPLRNLPVAVIGASTGAFGAVWAQAELRKVLGASGARVVEGDVALGHAHERFDEQGRLADDEARERLAEVLAELCAQVRPVPAAA
jgi:chromate reductase